MGLRSTGRSSGFSGARDPDTIVICDYGDVSAEQKKKFLLSYAPLRNVSAVKHRRIFVLDYVDLVESPRNPYRPSHASAPTSGLGPTANGPCCGPRPCPPGRCR